MGHLRELLQRDEHPRETSHLGWVVGGDFFTLVVLAAIRVLDLIHCA